MLVTIIVVVGSLVAGFCGIGFIQKIRELENAAAARKQAEVDCRK